MTTLTVRTVWVLLATYIDFPGEIDSYENVGVIRQYDTKEQAQNAPPVTLREAFDKWVEIETKRRGNHDDALGYVTRMLEHYTTLGSQRLDIHLVEAVELPDGRLFYDTTEIHWVQLPNAESRPYTV